MQNQKSAIVIGAGVGGLAVANILAKSGYKVDLYEKNSGPGGRMGLLKKDGFTFDTGPSWYLMKDVFEDYFKLFGKSTADYYKLLRLDPAYKVFFDDQKPVTITASLQQNLKTFESLEPGASNALSKYLDRAERNYKISLKYFLYNRFNSPKSLWLPAITKDLPAFLSIFKQSLHGYISKSFNALPIQQMLEYPSVFLGASPFNTPALYQLMSYLDFKEGVYYPEQGGIYSITEALVKLGSELGVKYHYQADAKQILTTGSQAIGVKLVSGKTKKPKKVYADLIISNADLNFTETKLLPKKYQTYPKEYWQKKEVGPSALLLYLGVKGALPELEHHNLFFIKQWQQNFDSIYQDKVWPQRASMYVSKTTQTDKTTAPKGHENLFVLVPLPAGAKKLTARQQDKYLQHYLEQLQEMSGITNLIDRITVKEVRTPSYFGSEFNSWQGSALGGMSHTLRQTAILRPSIKSKKLKNLYYVGAGTQPGIGVPMCLISAQLIYKDLAKDSSPIAPVKINNLVNQNDNKAPKRG